ncbi:unnamed protein product, partial [Aphanomyces euteiches]
MWRGRVGKSHILVALVLLLLKYPIESKGGWTPFVCYIPDSRQLLGTEIDVMKILHRNILLNVPNCTLQLVTIKDVWAFMQNKRVILVADHWNPINKNNPKCAMARERLGSCFGTSLHAEIRGMLVHASTPHALLPKPTTQENNVCYGGLKDDEFAVWLEHHPNIFTENKDELALLTSKVPLLLTAFARVYQVGDSWERVVQRVQQDTIVKDIFTLLKVFYANIDSNLDIVDFRFFYEDGLRGFCATSEIVQRLVYRVRTAKTAGHVLLKQWRGLVSNSPNRSTLGLDVEAIIKAKVCQRGIKGLCPNPVGWGIQKMFSGSSDESEALKLAIQQSKNEPGWMLLVPYTFDYPGVNMILVTKTTLVGISVTFDKSHSKLTPFFDLWGPLAESHGMEIK